jgi:Protein of unknown function (DUF3616)
MALAVVPPHGLSKPDASSSPMARPRAHPVRLTFSSGRTALRKPLTGLSALVEVGASLLTASDETSCLERLRRKPDKRGQTIRYASHERILLNDYLRFGVHPSAEADIEGLAFDGEYVWVVGSHSLVRPQPRRRDGSIARAAALRRLEDRMHRCLLARIPVDGETGELCASIGSSEGGRHAASLRVNRTGNPLIRALARDPHLGPFLRLPSKDNGLDIEGIAVHRERVFLGLRGPVLGGWAVVLEIRVTDGRRGELRVRPMSPSGARYRKHFLDLGGLGVRDLCMDGRDLLILAGPTMKLDGPAFVYRWPGAAKSSQTRVTFNDALDTVLELPVGKKADHPEGMTLVRADRNGRALMIVFEKASVRKRLGSASVQACLFVI